MSVAARPPLVSAEVLPLSVRLRAAGAHVFLIVALAAVAIRVATAALAFLANIAFPLHQDQGFGVYRHEHLLLDTFARYDSGWYHGIARNGYAWTEGGRSNLAFFPVYPLTMRTVGRIVGSRPSDLYFGGIVVSWVACIGAMLMLYRLARLDLDEHAAQRAVLFALLHPCAFFFGVVYSESTFLLLAVSAFYGFRTQRWWLGALAGGLVTATRVNGILLLPALAWLVWQSIRNDRRHLWPALAALACVPAGLVAWSAYCYLLSGNALEWMASIQRWEYVPGGYPFAALSSLVHELYTRPYHYLVHNAMGPYDALNGVLAVVAVSITPLIWRRFGTAYALVIIVSLLLPLSSGQYEGLGRYTSVLFPTALLLATVRMPLLSGLLLGLSSALYMLCLALFTNVHPLF